MKNIFGSPKKDEDSGFGRLVYGRIKERKQYKSSGWGFLFYLFFFLVVIPFIVIFLFNL